MTNKTTPSKGKDAAPKVAKTVKAKAESASKTTKAAAAKAPASKISKPAKAIAPKAKPVAKAAPEKHSGKLKVTLIRSTAGRKPNHRKSVLGLGLKKIGQTVELHNTQPIRGMVNQVSYLLKVVEAQ